MIKSNKISKSILWSGLGEISVKLINPFINMILARLLAPDAFGVFAVCNMFVSFVDIITDSGFGKYLIQNDFKDNEECNLYSSVAFWTNLIFSTILFLIIIIFGKNIAVLLGDKSYYKIISLMSLQIIFTAVTSIQTALLKRYFCFKQLFIVRVLMLLVPMFVTVPVAYFTRSYMSLVIGNLSSAVINSILLWNISFWKPKFYYSYFIFRDMIVSGFWFLCEALANWCIIWADIFIMGTVLSNYYVGLYKNSTYVVSSLLNTIAVSITPVLMSILSRLDNDEECFECFAHFIKLISYLILPIGVGIFYYREFFTSVLFGAEWSDAGDIVGLWGLSLAVSILFYNIPAEIYKSKGMANVLFGFQLLYLCIIIPSTAISVKLGFWQFVYTRSLIVICPALISLIFMKKYLKIGVIKFMSNLYMPFIATIFVVILCLLSRFIMPGRGYIFDILSIAVIILLYLLFIFIILKKDIMKSLSYIMNN